MLPIRHKLQELLAQRFRYVAALRKQSSGFGSRAPAPGYAIVTSSPKVDSGSGEASPVHEKVRVARPRK
eukprot:13912743-Alexandrium_andersonii.AAC.1